MQNTIDIGWLDVGIRKDSRLAVLDHGRLSRVIAQLPEPDSQTPSLCVFMGSHSKDHALRSLYPLNNIKRHTSDARVKLRYDVASLDYHDPVFLADGDIPSVDELRPPISLEAGVGLPVAWNIESAGGLIQVLWSRLIFMFADVICIFIPDSAALAQVTTFLAHCLDLGSASSLAQFLLPRVLFVYGSEFQDLENQQPDPLCDRLQASGHDLSRIFSGHSALYTGHASLSDIAKHMRIKEAINGEMRAISLLRKANHARPSGNHLLALFQSAIHHTLSDVTGAFDVTTAIRKDRPVVPRASSNLAQFLEIGHSARLSPYELAPSIASALLMDHYVPGMFVTPACVVFGTLYRSIVTNAYHSSRIFWPEICPSRAAGLVEREFCELLDLSLASTSTAVKIRRTQLQSQSGQLSCFRSNLICLFCLLNTAQHALACGHTTCDRCVQVFGFPVAGYESKFILKGCLYCLYQRPLTLDVLPPTMSPGILALDGGGVRGVIPLQFLAMVEEHLHPCKIQDVVDLALGTSSGGLIALGLFSMSWSVSHCSERFDTLARRIFSKRRASIFSLLPKGESGTKSFFGEAAKWVQWLIHDSCYDSRVFDAALKDAFGDDRRLFGVTAEDPLGSQQTGPKIGVVTTSICKSTRPFVIGNFNISQDTNSDVDYRIVRPRDTRHEPEIWRAGRATAAAPFFFTPVDLQGIGSFQDGGLKYNFAGEIATQVSRQIWPASIGSIRMISLGTGRAEASDQSPHFRHVFYDGFIRRGFDAWMSTMETDNDWKKWKSRLGDEAGDDCHRLDVSLGTTPQAIDAVEAMEDYRDLVYLQAGNARRAREAATTLLVSRLFFLVGALPEYTAAPFWCSGFVRCKGPAQQVMTALGNLYPDGLSYVSDGGLIDDFGGVDSLCASCGCYNRPISFLTSHLDHTVNIYIQTRSKKRWRISGFPGSVAVFAARQGLQTPFGQGDHGYPSREPCWECDVVSCGAPRGNRRKRQSSGSENVGSKKRSHT